ncbi:hypothetical protein EXIGLDRAFT_749862 [Exidia glandulosa HHB12029]|uniref:DUF6533 domain-containing protein n=1 Tax=Exidia glandulosa HHB12029 TaxID=1314781 RepID=A0A165HJQ8_EXIGL|nr:hypothetical protein EXIGLDRAFT_749862 [Exidia glandulosa HHB12029]
MTEGSAAGWTPQLAFEVQTWRMAHTSAFCLLVYDWLLSFDREVEYVWSRKLNLFTLLWVSTRYTPLVYYAVSLLVSVQDDWTARVCSISSTVGTVFLVTTLTASHSIFLLRTWMLYNRSKLPLLVLGPPLLLSAGLHLTTIHEAATVVLPHGSGCLPDSPIQLFGLLAWSATLLFDSLAFVFTVSKTRKYARAEVDGGIVKVFLRDGILFWGAMFACYFADLVLFSLAPQNLKDVFASHTVTLSSTLTSRLLLNLRISVQATLNGSDSGKTTQAHVGFAAPPRIRPNLHMTDGPGPSSPRAAHIQLRDMGKGSGCRDSQATETMLMDAKGDPEGIA